MIGVASGDKTTIKELGTSCVEVAYNEITGNDQLRQSFILCPNQTCDKLTDVTRSMIYEESIEKAFHVRIRAKNAIWKDENTSGFAADAVDTALRLGLKAITSVVVKATKG